MEMIKKSGIGDRMIPACVLEGYCGHYFIEEDCASNTSLPFEDYAFVMRAQEMWAKSQVILDQYFKETKMKESINN